MPDWRRNFFRKPIFTPGSPEALAKAPAEAAFIAEALRLKQGMSVLDVCCGTGRHAVRLARKGILVTGIDATTAYLERAARAAKGLKTLKLARADMRRLRFYEAFDAAYNVWTSFGYSSRNDDLRTLRGVARALKPGGLFLIDVIDEKWLRRNFKPQSWVRLGGGRYRLESSQLIEGKSPRVRTSWLIINPGRKAEAARFMVRLYDQARLCGLLKAAGLEPLRRWRRFGTDRSGRQLVVLARKPS